MKQVNEDGSFIPITLLTLSTQNETFYNVFTPVPADTSSYALDNATIIPLALRRDDDGDEIFSITGNLQGEWKDNENVSINTHLWSSKFYCLR